jgi:hypothetical protein
MGKIIQREEKPLDREHPVLPDANKILFFSAYYFLKVQLHPFSKTKSHKEVTKQYIRNRGFSYYFCLMIEGSVPLTKGS